jgi:hypothetical protein
MSRLATASVASVLLIALGAPRVRAQDEGDLPTPTKAVPKKAASTAPAKDWQTAVTRKGASTYDPLSLNLTTKDQKYVSDVGRKVYYSTNTKYFVNGTEVQEPTYDALTWMQTYAREQNALAKQKPTTVYAPDTDANWQSFESRLFDLQFNQVFQRGRPQLNGSWGPSFAASPEDEQINGEKVPHAEYLLVNQCYTALDAMDDSLNAHKAPPTAREVATDVIADAIKKAASSPEVAAAIVNAVRAVMSSGMVPTPASAAAEPAPAVASKLSRPSRTKGLSGVLNARVRDTTDRADGKDADGK